MSVAALALVAALAHVTALAQTAPDLGAGASATVGMPALVRELVLPGPELEALPADDASPLVLRVDSASPHGEHFRYDLAWYGLEPGEYDLASFLRRKDGATGPQLPPLAVTVRSLLAPGQVEPHRPAAAALPRLGGYRIVLGVAGAAWVAGLVLLLRAGRRRRAARTDRSAAPASPAAQLRALVAAAESGALDAAGRAELELALIALWRRRLGLEGLEAKDAHARLRAHPEAGALLAALEDWLHRPAARDVDLARLLAPYRSITDGGGAGGGNTGEGSAGGNGSGGSATAEGGREPAGTRA